MKEKFKEILEKYNISLKEFAHMSGIPYSSVMYSIEKSQRDEIRDDWYKKMFESLFLIAKRRIKQGYKLDHELDDLDSKLYYELILKHDKNNL